MAWRDFYCFYFKLNSMKTRFYLAILLLLLAFKTEASRISKEPAPGTKIVATMTDEQKKATLVKIKQRVEEIRNMDKSHLSHMQRIGLRKELKELKTQAKAVNGVYLSVGAIIIIILLLILIL
jgi:hypothetical protein